MTDQAALWRRESDSWYQRNKTALTHQRTGYADPIQTLLWQYATEGVKSIADIGCSNGWRVAQLARYYDCAAWGFDLSSQAIADGQRLYPHVTLTQGEAGDIALPDASVNLALASFLLHCVPREDLLLVASEMDRILEPGGLLLLNDFSPSVPTRVPWKHRDGLWTYKLPNAGAGVFVATGCYRQVACLTYNHDGGRFTPSVSEYDRCAVVLLRKESGYCE